MRDRVLWGTFLVAAIGAIVLGVGMQVAARSGGAAYGWGPGMMGGYGSGMGPWMMGPGMMGSYGGYNCPMAPGAASQRWSSPGGQINLSSDDIKNRLEGWLAWQGNPRLKLGAVSEKDANTVVADIVTRDKDALVQRFVVDRHTGQFRPSED